MQKKSMDDLQRLSTDAFQASDKFAYVLVLDNVRSMLNVGSVFRSADAFRASRVYLCGITGQPPHREIAKTALGADETVDWAYAQDTAELVSQLRAEGYYVCAIEQVQNSESLLDFFPEKNQPYAFVLGNEVFGVSEEVVKLSDKCLEIPQFGTKHSLNIAVTAGIVAWDFVSKSLFQQSTVL
jgi:23S rRNA (guanosine2251-2'-O)-methyltransferase